MHDTTENALELTFETNRLASFVIMNRIADLVNEGGRVVAAASSLHRNATYKNFEGILDANGNGKRDFAMIDGTKLDYKKAYNLSNLCTVSFCVELNRRLRSKGIVVNCFSPGLMTESELFRNHNFILTAVLSFMANTLFKFGDSVEWGGGCLAWMALAEKTGLRGG